MNKLRAMLEVWSESPNVRAFLKMLRVGEGTVGDDGYRTMYGGSKFTSYADHPRKYIKKGKWTSSAAGAYQFLVRTWDELVPKYGFEDFSPRNQDLAAIALIHRRKAMAHVLRGNIREAIILCNKEWASLPQSPYGQPTVSMSECLAHYQMYLEDERRLGQDL